MPNNKLTHQIINSLRKCPNSAAFLSPNGFLQFRLENKLFVEKEFFGRRQKYSWAKKISGYKDRESKLAPCFSSSPRSVPTKGQKLWTCRTFSILSLCLCSSVEPCRCDPGGGGGQGGGVRTKPRDGHQESVGRWRNTGVLRPTQGIPAVRLHQIVSIRQNTEILICSALPDSDHR